LRPYVNARNPTCTQPWRASSRVSWSSNGRGTRHKPEVATLCRSTAQHSSCRRRYFNVSRLLANSQFLGSTQHPPLPLLHLQALLSATPALSGDVHERVNIHKILLDAPRPPAIAAARISPSTRPFVAPESSHADRPLLAILLATSPSHRLPSAKHTAPDDSEARHSSR
jgi:hypothetical protein